MTGTVELAGCLHRVNTVFCIGRNYAAHAAELGNVMEEEPVVFLKPTAALLADGQPLRLPAFSSEVHYECELLVLVGRDADNVSVDEALKYVAGYGVGLDLTARDVQNEVKAKGLPWTKAKGFRGAACVSAFVPASVLDPLAARFTLHVNGELRQQGDTTLMRFSVPYLVSYLSQVYGLRAGDIIYTGTPAGVGRLHGGDRLALDLGVVQAQWQVAA